MGIWKIFFVREKLTYELEKNGKKVIYISLNGVKNIQEISKELYFKMMIFKIKEKKFFKNTNFESIKAKKLNSTVKIIGDIASNFLPIKINKNNVEELYKSFAINIENCVLIFDDLERCTINIIETLGYINTFVEYDNIKTILIANEKEIGQKISAENIELKYLISSQKEIDFEDEEQKKTKTGTFNPSKDQSDKKISINDLQERSEKLFGSDLSYIKIKEKLIGTTIYYRPDLDETIKAIIKKTITKSDVKKIITNNIDFIKKLMIDREHYNFRTLQFAFEKYMSFYNIIANLKLTKKNRVCNDIFKICLVVSFDYKANIDILKRSGEYDYSSYKITEENNLGYFIEKFNFIINEIMYSNFDKTDIEDIINSYINEIEENKKVVTKSDDPLSILQNWNIKEDDEIKIIMEEILKKLEDNKYDFTKYPLILMTFSNVVSIGFNEDKITICLNVMKKNIETDNVKKEIDFKSFGLRAVNQKALDKYNESIKDLENTVANIKNLNKISEIEKVFNTSDWGKNFEDYCFENHDNFLSKKEFFKLLDLNKIISKIKISKTIDIVHFKYGLDSVYNFSNLNDFYSEDLPSLLAFKNELQKMDTKEFNLTKKYTIQSLNEQVEKFITLIDKNKDKNDNKK